MLGVDIDAKGDLAAALGSKGARFRPEVAQPRVSVIALHAEESFQEYLNVYFKVPRLARMTPLARVFDFIATAVPGPRDMLVVGKIAFEERRRDDGGAPAWDVIVVDCSASGHIVSQLRAPRAMLDLVRGGVIRGQVEWIASVIADPRRTTAVLTALPEDMPVTETLDLHSQLARGRVVDVGLTVLNRMPPPPIAAAARRLLAELATGDASVRQRVPGASRIGADLELGDHLHASAVKQALRLRALDTPLAEVPLMSAHTGLATARAVAASLRGSAAAQ